MPGTSEQDCGHEKDSAKGSDGKNKTNLEDREARREARRNERIKDEADEPVV